MLAGNDGIHDEPWEFQADMSFVLQPFEVTEKSNAPMWADDSSVPAEWFLTEE